MSLSVFELPLSVLRPTQLYISRDKLRCVQYTLACGGALALSPVSVSQHQQQWILTEGHTRALALYYRGDQRIRCCYENEPLVQPMFQHCLDWCQTEGICQIADLAQRVVNHPDFERLWIQRCITLQQQLA